MVDYLEYVCCNVFVCMCLLLYVCVCVFVRICLLDSVGWIVFVRMRVCWMCLLE